MKTIYINNSATNPLSPIETINTGSSKGEIWRWGSDNLLPLALSQLSRSSPIHRRIIIDKADYISGRGFKCDDQRVTRYIECCNPLGHSLRSVVQRLAFDKCIFGNALLEVVVRDGRLALFHQDASLGRLSRDRGHMVFSSSWENFNSSKSITLPLYPNFEEQSDGTLRSIVHYKDYEPLFENYGVPKYIAALGAIAIAHKTERWNITRIDNAFSLSGVMVLDGSNSTEQEAEQIAREAKQRFEGTPGQVMFMVKDMSDGDNSKFVPISTQSDGDWKSLHSQSIDSIIVSHSWFRTLSGMEYSTGFSAERVQNEYNIALSTIIKSEQQDIIEPIIRILEQYTDMDSSTLEFVNIPPFDPRQQYLRVWEARKADGLSYDPEDIEQQRFLSQI